MKIIQILQDYLLPLTMYFKQTFKHLFTDLNSLTHHIFWSLIFTAKQISTRLDFYHHNFFDFFLLHFLFI